MQTFPFTIDYYVTESDRIPFKDWLEGLRDVSGRAKIRVRLDRARLGNLGDHCTVGEGVSELRIDYGPGYRVYYGLDGDRLILLLLGGDKASQEKDIARAKGLWRDHQRRNRHA
ncbi:MAG: addiction module protein [Desulfuromonadales bacterium GWC2_61_20]|nr:MAG: addiction module protein [Desulfuromonadales bacterium GWC2_61_20]